MAIRRFFRFVQPGTRTTHYNINDEGLPTGISICRKIIEDATNGFVIQVTGESVGDCQQIANCDEISGSTFYEYWVGCADRDAVTP